MKTSFTKFSLSHLLLLSLFMGFCPHVMADEDTDKRYDRFFMEAMMHREKGESDAAFELFRHCTEIDSTKAEAYFFLSQYYEDLKDKEQALRLLERAAKLEPTNLTFIEPLASLYFNNERYADAIAAIEKVLELDKEREDLLMILIRLYDQENQLDKAISAAARLEEVEGKSERLTYIKSDLYTRLGKQQAAINETKALADQYPSDLNYRCLHADILYRNGQAQEGEKMFEEILQEDPENIRAMMSLKEIYTEKDDTIRLDSITRTLLTLPQTDEDLKCLLMKGEIRKNEKRGGDSTAVLNLFRLATSQKQEGCDLLLLYASYMEMKEMPKDSIKPLLKQVLGVSPDNVPARLRLLLYAWERNDMDQAVSLCKDGNLYTPEYLGFYYYQGMAFYRMDKYDEALDILQKGKDFINDETDTELAANFYEMMAELYHKKGLNSQAYAAYDSCLQWKSDDAGCLNNYAYYLCLDGIELDKAEKMSRKSIDLDPKNANNLDTYAWILFCQGRHSEARIYIEQALQNDSTNSVVLLEHAGDIYACCNDIGKALEYWKKAAAQQTAKKNKTLFRKIKRKKYLKQ